MAIYMKIDGIDGDVSAKGYEKWIEVQAMNFGVNRSINTAPGKNSDRESTKPSVGEIIVSKLADKSSPHLFSASCAGAAKKEVKIHFCKTGHSKEGEVKPYLEYTLNDVLVSNYKIKAADITQTAGATSGANEVPVETVNFNFNKIEMKHTEHDGKNNAGTPVTTSYDLATAAAA